ncbi:hypothetical protein Q5752_007125 [Cryptotrichosporon argae]
MTTAEPKSIIEHHELKEAGDLPMPSLPVYSSYGVVRTLRAFRKAALLCTAATLGALSDGFQFSVPGSIIANTGFIHQFGSKSATGTWALNAYHVSAWSGMYTGAYIAVLLAVSRGMVNVQGLAIGLNQCTATAYISELAPTNARGALLAAYNFWFGIGQFASAIALEVVAVTKPLLWRRAIYSEWVFTGLAISAWVFLPESPRWLLQKGRDGDARRVLERVNGQVEGYDVDRELAMLQEEVAAGLLAKSQSCSSDYRMLFKSPNLRRLFVSFWPFAYQTWVGNTIIYGYTTYFFSLAGLTFTFGANVAVKTISIVFTAISFFTIERLGRRPLILGGSFIMVASMFAIAGAAWNGYNSGKGIALVTFACIWTAAYALSIGPLGYAYLGETSQVTLRAKSTSLAAAGTGILNLVSNYCTPIMLANTTIGVRGSALFYALTGVIGLFICYFTIPETRGRTYVELDELFERKISARNFAATETMTDMARREAQEGGTV